MKNFNYFIKLILFILTINANSEFFITPKAPNINASSFAVMDYNSSKILASKDLHKHRAPASLTKLMTSYVIFKRLQSNLIKLDDEVLISHKAWKTIGSRSFLKVNSKVKLETILKAMIIQSGNDASVALAEHIAGTEDTFVMIMNKYAKELGMNNTNFETSSGLPHKKQFTTSYDMLLLAQAIIKEFPIYYKWFSEKEFVYNKIKQKNRNKLLLRDKSVDGLKTGYTKKAGYCLATSAKRENMRLISILLGSPDAKIRLQQTSQLLDYGFRFFETQQLINTLPEVKIYKGNVNKFKVDLKDNKFLTLERGKFKFIKHHIKINKNIVAPIKKGEKVGELIVSFKDEVIKNVPIIALTDVKEAGFFGRIIDTIFIMVFLNGKFLEQSLAKISTLDRGFLFGDGIYEVIPVYNGKIFKLTKHLERLNKNLKFIDIKNPYSFAKYQKIINKLIAFNACKNQSIYLQITRGTGLDRSHNFNNLIPTIYIRSDKLKIRSKEDLISGFSAILEDDIRWNYCNIKSISLLANIIYIQKAKQQQIEEVILSKNNIITEGASSNVFMRKDNIVYTPKANNLILRGITRDMVIQSAIAKNIKVLEQDITKDTLLNSDEVWISSSTREIMPITKINNKKIGDGSTSLMWEQIYHNFQQLKMIDKRKQQLIKYLNKYFNNTNYKVLYHTSDASFRRYFRIIINSQSFIAMDSPPKLEKIDNFIKITNFLKKNNINSPKIYAQNQQLGFLLLEDFGDLTLLEKQQQEFNIIYYQQAIDELIKIQNLANHINLDDYDKNTLIKEMQIANKWYIKNNQQYEELYALIINNITQHKKVIVHRDYHSRNIMINNNNIAILDFQDAVIGSYVYDLASLLKDAYIKISNNNLTKLLMYYFKQAKLTNFDNFIVDFDMISIQRHIKILGIFSRLKARDNKDQYLQNIPLIINYLLAMSKKYKLKQLEQLCKQ